VVFVTGQSDFDARVESTLSGGSDLLGKPFLTFEITVKALTLALQNRLRNPDRKIVPNHDPNRRPEASPAAVRNVATVPAVPALDLPPVPKRAPTPVQAFPPQMEEVTVTFLTRAHRKVGELRELCRTILTTSVEETRQNLIAEGFLTINSLIPQDGTKVVHPAYQMSLALEGLFRKLLQNPKHTNSSTLATIMCAVELLLELCVPGLKADLAVNPPIHTLVVDDDLVARRALVGALQTALHKPESATDGTAALALARERRFDVIFLDILMPGMDGFEVCSKIRDAGPNAATPVVFVTGLGDFETRSKAGSHGGNDLIGKPFLTPEITVKALTLALSGRLQQFRTQLAAV
jgi:CheY-like chemotaxis protein